MTPTSRALKTLLLAVSLIGFTACGGGDTPPAPAPTLSPAPALSPAAAIASQTLADPTPGVNDAFGTNIVILANGNIVVTDPFDSSLAAGAVHLYNPFTQTLISSIFGDTANDSLGRNGITALANNNFVIASIYDDEGGIVDAGSVRLVNGATGV